MSDTGDPKDRPSDPGRWSDPDGEWVGPTQARALRALAREAAEASMRSPDWERLERELMTRIEADRARDDYDPTLPVDQLIGEDDEPLRPSLTDLTANEAGSGRAAQDVAEPERRRVTEGSHVPWSDRDEPRQPSVPVRESGRVPASSRTAGGSGRSTPSKAGAVAEGAAHRGVGRPARLAFFAAVAAAAAMLLFWRASSPERTASLHDPVEQDATLSLAELSAGDVVETGLRAKTFSVEGDVAWTLGPGSRAVVLAAVAEDSHVIRLERGSVRAEIVPRPDRVVERFVVMVEDTRVAVRGTVFTVSRAGPGLVVDVERGSVAVGALGTSGQTEGRLLVAPERASFSLDGGSTARRLPRPEAPSAGTHLTETPPASAATAASQPSPPSPSVAKKPSTDEGDDDEATPVPEPAFLTEESIRNGLYQCVVKHYGQEATGPGGTPVGPDWSVASVFHVSVREDGSVMSARLDPPLKSEVAVCAGPLIVGQFKSGPMQLQIPVQYQP